MVTVTSIAAVPTGFVAHPAAPSTAQAVSTHVVRSSPLRERFARGVEPMCEAYSIPRPAYSAAQSMCRMGARAFMNRSIASIAQPGSPESLTPYPPG